MSAFATLLAQPGVEEVNELRGRVGFMAYHGGALEAMTDVIARLAAERANASCYSVIQPPGIRDHLPSIQVNPDESAALATFVEHVDIVITVHGYGRAACSDRCSSAAAIVRSPSTSADRCEAGCPPTTSAPRSTRSPSSCGACIRPTR